MGKIRKRPGGRDDKALKTVTSPNPKQQIYQNNLAALKVRFPDAYRQIDSLLDDSPIPVQAFANSDGQANARFVLSDGRQIPFYEAQDIVKDIDRQIDEWQLTNKDFLCCIGMGLGYLPLIASQHLESRPSILIFEPNPAILILALQLVDLQPLLRYPKLHLFLGVDVSIQDRLLPFKDSLFFGKIQLIGHGASRSFFGESFEQFEKALVDNIQVIRNSCYTVKAAGSQIITNTMANLPSLFGGPDLGKLRGLLNGFPAICVAAGPSLDKDIELLQSIGERAAILCCDSAVHTLVSAKITPHMVVTTDRLPVNFEKIRYDLHHLRDTVLVFGVEANPDNVRAFLSGRRFGVSADSVLLNRWLGPQLGLEWRLPAMTSVSHTAIFTAMALGADPIILAGMDFALAEGRSHARGSMVRYPNNPDAVTSVEGVNGRPAKALPQLIADRRQIETVAANHRARLIDVSMSGARIRGTEVRSLQEVIDTLLGSQAGVRQRLDGVVWEPSAKFSEVILAMDQMLAKLERFNDDCRQSQRNCLCRISGGGSQPADITDIRNDLMRFEKQHDLLMRILQMLRYSDVQTLTSRMEGLKAARENSNDGNLDLRKELAIYADHYASLGKAGGQFEALFHKRIEYFKKEARFQSRLSEESPAPEKMITLARHYHRSGELWRAEPIYRCYLNLCPDDASAWLALGELYMERGVWRLALELIADIKDRFRENEMVETFEKRINQKMGSIFRQAKKSFESGNIENARRQLMAHQSIFPENEDARNLHDRISHLYEKSEENVLQRQQPSINKEEAADLESKAKQFMRSGQVEPAVGILEGLALEMPELAGRFRERIGDIRREQQDYAGAAWHYRKALALSSGNSILESKLLDARRRQMENTSESSASESNTSSKINESTLDDLYKQAQDWIGAGDIPKAIRALEKLLTVQPNAGQVHNDLGVLYFNDGDKDSAYRHYRQAVTIEPGNVTFQKNLADFTYVVLGDVKAALEIYVKMLRENPGDTGLLTTLGQVCINEKQYDDARHFIRRALTLDPDNQYLQQVLQHTHFKDY